MPARFSQTLRRRRDPRKRLALVCLANPPLWYREREASGVSERDGV